MKSFLPLAVWCLLAGGTLHAQNIDRLAPDAIMPGLFDERMVEETNDPSEEKRKISAAVQRNFNLLSRMGFSMVLRQYAGKPHVLQGYYSDGSLAFSADCSKFSLNGTWVGLYAWGSTRDEGLFKGDKPDGVWRGYYSNGSLRFLREYDADKIEAANAELYRQNPKQTFYLHDSDGYSISQVHSTLTSAMGSFADLVATGDAYRPPFEQCLHNGMYINYYPNGQAKDSGYYKNGRRQGYWHEWYSNGTLKQLGFYEKGEKHSSWKLYNEKGVLVQLEEYRRGRLVHTKKY
jgi:antitoxin component YwqK of YwqJK toxin-antitoxin module